MVAYTFREGKVRFLQQTGDHHSREMMILPEKVNWELQVLKSFPGSLHIAWCQRLLSGNEMGWLSFPIQQGSPNPGLLGTGRHNRRWAAVGWGASEALCAPPMAPHRSHYYLNHPPSPLPAPWKNCLPRNQSLVPKIGGTTATLHL